MDESSIPSAEICQDRCIQFAAITQTNTALAQFYLQDRSWDLSKSIDDYFGENIHENVTVDKANIKVYSWNTDGLDDKNIKSRTMGVCEAINNDKPSVIFLQEIVQTSLALLLKNLPDYEIVEGKGSTNSLYFLCTLFHRHFWADYTLKFDYYPFINSLMDRGYQVSQALSSTLDINYVFINTHLESTNEPQFSAIRKEQYKKLLEIINLHNSESVVIVGGDMNIRDKEVSSVLNPLVRAQNCHESDHGRRCLLDLWEACGSRQECRYTYDATLNQNIPFYDPGGPGDGSKRFKGSAARLRFDRLYLSCPVSALSLPGSDVDLYDLFKSPSVSRDGSRVKRLKGVSGRSESLPTSDGPQTLITRQIGFKEGAGHDRDSKNEPTSPNSAVSSELPSTGVPKNSFRTRLEPTFFGLVGLEKLASCHRFPSDHWGLKAILKIVKG